MTSKPAGRWQAATLCAALYTALYAGAVPAYAADDDPVIAIINDYEITASDINEQIVQMPLGDQVSIRSDPEKFAE